VGTSIALDLIVDLATLGFGSKRPSQGDGSDGSMGII
jgi:hypothetical protein